MLIKCFKCQSRISDRAVSCPYCGVEISYNYRTQYRAYIKSPISEKFHPKSWLLESLLLVLASVLLFTIWCLPFAVASCIYANRVEGLWKSGDIDGAILASEKAGKYYKIGLWIGIGTWVIIILIFCLLIILILINIWH